MSSSSVSSPSPITRTNHLPQRLKRELFDTIVHIAVGPKKELFRLHKGLLCSASPFFRAALEGKFVESKTQAIDMPEEDVVMFRYLQMWLYTDSFLEGGEEASAVPWHTLINIYAFAEAHLIPHLQNAAIDAICEKHEHTHQLPTDLITLMYAKTLATSPIRRWLVDMMSTRCNPLIDHWWDGYSYPSEFFIELLRKLHKQKAGYYHLLSKHIKLAEPSKEPCKFEDYHIQPPAEKGSQQAPNASDKPPSLTT